MEKEEYTGEIEILVYRNTSQGEWYAHAIHSRYSTGKTSKGKTRLEALINLAYHIEETTPEQQRDENGNDEGPSLMSNLEFDRLGEPILSSPVKMLLHQLLVEQSNEYDEAMARGANAKEMYSMGYRHRVNYIAECARLSSHPIPRRK